VVDLSIAELRSTVTDGVSSDELALAKQASRSLILLSLEDSASRAAALAQSEMTHGRQIPVEETLAKIDAVTVEDCRAVANEFFKTENVAFAALGDLDGVDIQREKLRIL
jgi:predicted Zn-dependent peptidase